MSTALPITERSSDASPAAQPPSQHSKPRRVLACVLCQQRKVKCDRKYPCANCIRSRAQCVPATQVSRRRRRRFPERELLERIRKYEDLLRQNSIRFEPLHKESEKESSNVQGSSDSVDEQRKTTIDQSSPSTTPSSERAFEAKKTLHATSQEFREQDDYSESSDDDAVPFVEVKHAWEQLYENDDHLLFGSRKTAVDIATFHPEPVQIFKLWQLYLENVDPLLKVTHTPSLQGRIIEATGDVLHIKPTFEALMFGIYCMSILSLTIDDCQAIFGSAKIDLLTRYQFGCQQALQNCGFLRCGDRDCLTALYFYLISIRTTTVPQSLSSMLGVAIRIAQRMGIHSESALSRCSILEAEMRRRLWWSLVLFDARVGEMADFKPTALNSAWNCKIPVNVNDCDLRPEMKEVPQIQGISTEALFAVVRSELGNFVRHTTFHLDHIGAAPEAVAKDAQQNQGPEGSELVSLEKLIEDRYLKFCDLENPLHFMTVWMTRAYLAKWRVLEHRSMRSSSSAHQTEAQRDAVISYAISMLECDTKIMGSPLTKGFLWLLQLYFPFFAYIQITQNLKRRPTSEQADRAWTFMSANYEARFGLMSDDHEFRFRFMGDNEGRCGSLRRNGMAFSRPFFKIFSHLILQAWEAREAIFKQLGKPLEVPRIVSSIQQKVAELAQYPKDSDIGQPSGATDIVAAADLTMSMPIGFSTYDLYSNIGGHDGYAVPLSEAYTHLPGLPPLDVNLDQLEWSAMDWDSAFATGEAGASTNLSLPY